jgi:hypothetical protein
VVITKLKVGLRLSILLESLLNKINLFKEFVIETGLKRDLIDYTNALGQPQNRNLVFMKSLAEKLKNYFFEIKNNSIDTELQIILKDTKPFTTIAVLDEIEEINEDPELLPEDYFQKFFNLLERINQLIISNEDEISTIEAIFNKYTKSDESSLIGEQALLSLVFKDLQSTSSLKEFSKVLNRWNRTLLIYHTLLKSQSPEEISLVEIQNGSIDVIFSIDFDIAIELTELIKLGLKVYSAYLLYKSKTAREIIESYAGNSKLIKSENDREKLMLDNIKDSIKLKVLEQHNDKLLLDKNIEKAGAEKKADEISRIITDHIIKGNEVKLLNASKSNEEDDKITSSELRASTTIVRERFKELEPKDKLLLIEKYYIKTDEFED